ncbi:Lipid II flippase MurJ [Bacillus licheniformis]|nr:Lipid II flippase MurJ [Bacillus licheniformis]
MAIVTLYVPKLVMIPVSLATAFGLTLIPAVTENFTNKDFPALNKQIDQAMQIILFIVLPASVGMALLSGPVYTFFYGSESLLPEMGRVILFWYAPVALLFSLFTVNAAILQGVNKQKFAVVSLMIGIVIKIALNVPLIKLFQGSGSILATALGYSASLLYGFIMIKRHAGYSYRKLFKRFLLMLILTAVMGIILLLVQALLSLFISYEGGQIRSAVVIFITTAVGGSVYLYLAYRVKLLEKIFGQRLNRFFKRKSS